MGAGGRTVGPAAPRHGLCEGGVDTGCCRLTCRLTWLHAEQSILLRAKDLGEAESAQCSHWCCVHNLSILSHIFRSTLHFLVNFHLHLGFILKSFLLDYKEAYNYRSSQTTPSVVSSVQTLLMVLATPAQTVLIVSQLHTF